MSEMMSRATETWEDRYKRAVATHAGVPADIPLDAITVDVMGEDGYAYSSYTFADPSIRIRIGWIGADGRRGEAEIEGPEAIAGLIRSFLSPGSEKR